MNLIFKIIWLFLLLVVGCDQNRGSIVAKGSVKVLSESECSFYKNGQFKLLTTLKMDDKASILRVEYPKDCMVYKIRLNDGRIGYVTFGDHFEAILSEKYQKNK